MRCQKSILTAFARDNGFPNVQFYVDDGVSGTTFERDGFKAMMNDIEARKVGIVITKLSRLGRDYLKTGEHIEIIFPDYDVRYIAINDNVDTFKSENELMAFKNIFNDWYYSLNIICYTENEQYHSYVEKIVVTIKNQNPGKGFYYYAIPYIEKNIDGEWVRLNYNEKAQERFSVEREWWEFCGIQGDDTIPYSTNNVFFPNDLEENLTIGEYRIVIFVGKEIIYAPFTVVD